MTENAFWSETRKSFIETDYDTFKLWKSVQSVPIYAFYQFEEYYGRDVAQLIFRLKGKINRDEWMKALKEPFLGHNEESYAKVKKQLVLEKDVVETSPWALKSAHHVLMFIENSKNDLMSFDQIVEFGPGIGETCRLINDLGYKGDYYLYDLPEVLKISSFYNKAYENVKSVTHYSEIDPNKKTLFIGTWSISEIPFSLRDDVFNHFKNADYLIIYQKNAFEYSNESYFMLKFPQIINKNIKIIDISWLQGIAGGNRYLFLE